MSELQRIKKYFGSDGCISAASKKLKAINQTQAEIDSAILFRYQALQRYGKCFVVNGAINHVKNASSYKSEKKQILHRTHVRGIEKL